MCRDTLQNGTKLKIYATYFWNNVLRHREDWSSAHCIICHSTGRTVLLNSCLFSHSSVLLMARELKYDYLKYLPIILRFSYQGCRRWLVITVFYDYCFSMIKLASLSVSRWLRATRDRYMGRGLWQKPSSLGFYPQRPWYHPRFLGYSLTMRG
jgi:hypothetical protein